MPGVREVVFRMTNPRIMVCIRLPVALKARLDAVRQRGYPVQRTKLIERGIELALAELEGKQ